MPRQENTDTDPINQGSATQRREGDTSGYRDDLVNEDMAGEENPLTRAEATLSLVSDWFDNLQTLARAEFSRTLAAGAQILGLSLVLLPMAGAFVVSLCAGVGLVGYYFFQSIYIGFGIFLLTQLLLLTGIILYQRKLRTLLGFDETQRQVKQALNDVIESLK